MIASVYLFGELGAGYTQYLDDHTRSIFKEFANNIKANTQILVHREDNTVYYAYIRRLLGEKSSNKYIGMCFAVSGCLLTDYNSLFLIFESTVSTLVSRGSILEYTDDGNITSSVDKLYQCKAEFALIADYLRLQLDAINPNHVIALPPLDFSVNTKESRSFKISDSADEILKAIGIYSNVFLLKNKDYDSAVSRSYAGKIRALNVRNNALAKKNSELESTIASLRRQQKRLGWVLFLIFVIILGGFITLSVLQNKNKSIGRLTREKTDLSTKVSQLNDDKQHLESDLTNMQSTLRKTEAKLNEANTTLAIKTDSLFNALVTIGNLRKADKELSAYKSNLSRMPLIITDVQVANTYENGAIETNYGGYLQSKYTMFLNPKIKYIGTASGNKTIWIKLFTPDGLSPGSVSGYSYSYSINTYLGKNEASIVGWGGKDQGHWRAGEYHYEFYCDGICVGSHTFTIH